MGYSSLAWDWLRCMITLGSGTKRHDRSRCSTLALRTAVPYPGAMYLPTCVFCFFSACVIEICFLPIAYVIRYSTSCVCFSTRFSCRLCLLLKINSAAECLIHEHVPGKLLHCYLDGVVCWYWLPYNTILHPGSDVCARVLQVTVQGASVSDARDTMFLPLLAST